jgi:hypothetical protein
MDVDRVTVLEAVLEEGLSVELLGAEETVW